MSSPYTLTIALKSRGERDSPLEAHVDIRDSPFPLRSFGNSLVRKIDPKLYSLAARFYSLQMTGNEPVELGRQLGAIAFDDQLSRDIDAHFNADRSLRIVLLFEPDDPALLFLPWEMLRLDFNAPGFPTDLYAEFIALRFGVSIAREFTGMQRGDGEPIASRGTIGVFSSPDDPESPKLNFDAEKSAIQNSPGGNDFRLIVSPPNRPRMSEEVRTHGAQYRLFHFSGHGIVGRNLEEESVLLLEDSLGKPDPISAQEIAVLCAGSKIQVAVLNACETGTDGVSPAMGPGVGTALFRSGVKNVVAMQTKLYASAGEAFSRAFYRALAARQTIDFATNAARHAMYQNSARDKKWQAFSPVLYRHFEISVHSDVIPPTSYDKSAELSAQVSKDRHAARGFWARLLGLIGVSASMFGAAELSYSGSLWQSLLQYGSVALFVSGVLAAILLNSYLSSRMEFFSDLLPKVVDLEDKLKQHVGRSFASWEGGENWIVLNARYSEIVTAAERWADIQPLARRLIPFDAPFAMAGRSNSDVARGLSGALVEGTT